MECPDCGKETSKDNKFCTSCGTPLGDQTTEMKTVPAAPPPVPPVRHEVQPTTQFAAPPPGPAPVVPQVAPPPAVKRRMSKGAKIALIVFVAVLVVGGAAAGIVIWRVNESNKAIAQVTRVDVIRSDGASLDLDAVPLDVGLELTATYTARYKEDGAGKLRLSIGNSDGEKIIDETFDVKSSGGPQTQSVKFSMTKGSGKALQAKAQLTVTSGDEKMADSSTTSYTAVEGLGKEAQFDEAKKTATDKLADATKAVQELAALGISASDLVEQLSTNVDRLKAATTAEEAEEVSAFADKVIAECDARKAAAADQRKDAQSREVCRSNQAALRQALYAFYNSEGNFPNAMSDMVSGEFIASLPKCPSGGTYSYQVTNFSLPTFDVICSVHGTL